MTMRRLSLLTVVLAFLVPAYAFGASPQNWQKKLDHALEQTLKKGNAPVQVIVRARDGEETNVRALLGKKGKKIKVEHPAIKAFTAQVNTDDLADLAASDSVESLSIDANLTADPTVSADCYYTDATYGSSNRLRSTLGLNDSSLTGRYVTVAVIDSGIAPKDDLYGRIVGFYDFTHGGVSASPSDVFGHGTHVAELIGGDGTTSPSGMYEGVAPSVRYLGLKVLDGNGSGQTSDVIAAIEFAIRYKSYFHIDVINLSLGHPIFESAKTDPLVLAVEKASAAGIVVVCSAGNWGTNPNTGKVGYAGITSPGNARSAITVGAVDIKNTPVRSDDAIADYSSRGPSWYDASAKPDIVAPGHALVAGISTQSNLYINHPELRVIPSTGYHFLRLSGTSMASAVASGVAALVIRSHRYYRPYEPDLTPNAVKAILQFSAIPVSKADGTKYDALTQGTGQINASGAIKLAAYLNFTAPGNTNFLTSPISFASTIYGQSLAWSQDILWGDMLVHGGDIIWGDDIVWSDDILWGESVRMVNGVVSGTDVLWGEDVVWGDDILWGEDVIWGDDILWGEDVIWGDSLVGTTYGADILWGELQRPDLTVWGNLAATSLVGGIQ